MFGLCVLDHGGCEALFVCTRGNQLYHHVENCLNAFRWHHQNRQYQPNQVETLQIGSSYRLHAVLFQGAVWIVVMCTVVDDLHSYRAVICQVVDSIKQACEGGRITAKKLITPRQRHLKLFARLQRIVLFKGRTSSTVLSRSPFNSNSQIKHLDGTVSFKPFLSNSTRNSKSPPVVIVEDFGGLAISISASSDTINCDDDKLSHEQKRKTKKKKQEKSIETPRNEDPAPDLSIKIHEQVLFEFSPENVLAKHLVRGKIFAKQENRDIKLTFRDGDQIANIKPNPGTTEIVDEENFVLRTTKPNRVDDNATICIAMFEMKPSWHPPQLVKLHTSYSANTITTKVVFNPKLPTTIHLVQLALRLPSPPPTLAFLPQGFEFNPGNNTIHWNIPNPAKGKTHSFAIDNVPVSPIGTIVKFDTSSSSVNGIAILHAVVI